ncbi:adenylate/guanylate cyclase domain-containing protein [Candidatus Villigracilis saccharophilus]|uniref:adenylate/guanylate cyclase domain-containing protein n=1 Tax=Candidatus Villigracilis saccharophilus TaxID=3140684 RepID=UPI003135EB20|nr:adenylate/guanylate cyclase domain-containing protein [Anaerolineales bacterium]
MTNLPSGTVTFLFTDIEGSTKIAQQYPNDMPVLLARHNQILNQAIKAHNGSVFQIVGDSFSAAFHNAIDGLNAVLAAQHALHTETWGETGAIKVRMGLHTGTAELLSDGKYDDYATIASTQRVMSAAHGEQTLLTQTSMLPTCRKTSPPSNRLIPSLTISLLNSLPSSVVKKKSLRSKRCSIQRVL